jgi:hypothetical protein
MELAVEKAAFVLRTPGLVARTDTGASKARDPPSTTAHDAERESSTKC